MVVTIAPEVPAGLYDVVAVGRFGASAARGFVVGTGDEVAKQAEVDSPAKALVVPADAAVNARATASKSDHYAVELPAGRRIRAEIWARRIDSRMTPVLEVLDAGGRVVATARRQRDDDPFVDFTAPADGRYVLRVHDLYAGGGDEVHYRLGVSTAPQVDFVFPPAARPGESAKVEVYGVGLPGGTPSGLPGLSAREGTAGDEHPGVLRRRARVGLQVAHQQPVGAVGGHLELDRRVGRGAVDRPGHELRRPVVGEGQLRPHRLAVGPRCGALERQAGVGAVAEARREEVEDERLPSLGLEG
ncbi:MAG: PPC domain-containing protein, partial [Solirubrobacterales bacterium]